MTVPLSRDFMIGAALATFSKAMRGTANPDSLRHYVETYREIGIQEEDLATAYEAARRKHPQVPSLQELESQQR